MKALKVSHFSNYKPHVGVCGCTRERTGKRERAQVNVDSAEERGRARSSVQLRSHQIMAQRPNGGKVHPLQLKAAVAEQLAKCDPRIALRVVLSEIGVRGGASNLARLCRKL